MAQQTMNFQVDGMTCAACQANVQRTVQNLTGVKETNVNLLTGNMIVEVDPDVIDGSSIAAAVTKIGYVTHFQDETSTSESDQTKGSRVNVAQQKAWQEAASIKSRMIASICWMIPLMYLTMGSMFGLPLPRGLLGTLNSPLMAFTQLLLTIPVLFLNREIFINGFKALAHRVPNMDSLIAVGSSASAAYGIYVIYRLIGGLSSGNMATLEHFQHQLYFEGAAMILTVISIGRYLEARSKGHTTDAISRLIELTPDEASVMRDGVFITIPSAELRVGDIVRVLTGASVPADGIIREGFAAMDESALTGESMPVEKQVGDHVTGGTISRGGYFTFEVTKTGEDTALAAIIRLVEEAASSKAPVSRMADKVAAVFVPVVMGIALLVLIIWWTTANFELALGMSVSVLVISCPCALGLATPLAIMAGTGSGTKYGILIKSGDALETAHHVTTVVLDKTGTITVGEPVVNEVITADGIKEELLLTHAATVEQYSEHVLAQAIMKFAKTNEINPPNATNFRATAGMGVSCNAPAGHIEGGNLNLALSKGNLTDHVRAQIKQTAADLSDRGRTPLFFFIDSQYLGALGLADRIKETSPAGIAQLKNLDIQVVMLTGDNRRTAEAVRQQVGLDQVISDVLPDEKQAVIAELQKQGQTVAMVGDGINDAPALEKADVGITIGSGTDVAIDAADIVLMKDDLRDVSIAIDLSHKTLSNIKGSLFWAFFYNVLCIPIAAGIFYPRWGLQLNPMIAATAMALSSIFVVLNALRLTRYRPRFAPVSTNNRANQTLVSTPDRTSSDIEKDDPSDKTISQDKDELICICEAEAATSSPTKQTYILKVDGMTCPNCVRHVTEALQSVAPSSTVNVDLESGTARITSDNELQLKELIQAVTEAGYEIKT
ncbi:MAG: heavy metal translocating P-type ATPase [Fastidiosipilaceae bacterium]